MDEPFYIEVSCQQRNFGSERICGDVFLSRRINEEQRLIAVLSDGMGHGVKANVLATLTATLAVNFTLEHKDVHDLAEIIMNTLPVCSEREMSYSTFSILDVEYTGETHILEYGNPQSIIMRGTEVFEPEWQCIILNSKKNAGKELRYCSFRPGKEDRIIVCSDGIMQSGTGYAKYPAGWGEGNVKSFIIEMLDANPALSARKLSAKIVNRAFLNDNFGAKDDSSCVTFYFREPRKLLVCTGPPFEDENDSTLAERLRQFQGKKIVCGATTADIIAREMKVSIRDSYIVEDPGLPPVSYMDGVELVTEGILTLSKVFNILNHYNPNFKLGKGPADLIVKLLQESDEIHFLIGTRINIAHQDPTLPVELEIRRTVVKRIARLLEEKFLKSVHLQYI